MSTTRPQPAREVAYAQEGIFDEHGDHMVALITENEPGYSASTYTGTLDYCKGVADAINEAKGHTRREVLDVVHSSMAAQRRTENFLAGSGELTR